MAIAQTRRRGRKETGFQSPYLTRESVAQYDRENMERLANLVGIDLDALEDQLAKEKKIRNAAWRDKKKTVDQRHSQSFRYIPVQNFQGRQLFISPDLGFLVSLGGTATRSFNDLSSALNTLACG